MNTQIRYGTVFPILQAKSQGFAMITCNSYGPVTWKTKERFYKQVGNTLIVNIKLMLTPIGIYTCYGILSNGSDFNRTAGIYRGCK